MCKTRDIWRCSTSLIIKEMQIETTMKSQLTPVKMAVINKSTNNKHWWECEEKGTLGHSWECRMVKPLCKTIWRFLKKLKIELLYDLEIPLLGRYPKELKTLIWKDIGTSMFIEALFTIAKTWEQTMGPSIHEQIKKMYPYTMK